MRIELWRASMAAAALAIVACSGATSNAPVVKTTSAELSALPRYRTYEHATALYPPEGYTQGPDTAEVLETARRDVDAVLQSKGYAPSEDADLVVRLSSGTRTFFESPTGGEIAVGAPEREVVEGALVVDLLDRRTGQIVFHGFARTEDIDDEHVWQAVSKMLAPVPDRPLQ